MKIRLLLLLAILFGLGCSSMYYGAMEKMGVHKRDIMVDRVKARVKRKKKQKNSS